MRFFPRCNEGFRRISIVVSILTVIAALGWGLSSATNSLNARGKICGDVYVNQAINCYNEQDEGACERQALNEEMRCYKTLRASRSEVIKTYAAYVILGKLCIGMRFS